jgi:hypothetical protein
MSSNAPHSSTRRYVTAAAAALACLLPAACDAAAASPAYHNKPPTTARSGSGENHHGGGKTSAPSSASAPAETDPASADPSTDPAAGDPSTDPAAGDPSTDPAATDPASADPTSDAAATTTAAAGADGTLKVNGLDVLARSCADGAEKGLTPHTGFQVAPACVSTAFGAVAAQDKDPSLLITNSPRFVRANTAFTLKVSTRNLVRDRFLGAAAGGYYLESSVLTSDGLQRGHFHTACRMLASLNVAPDPAAVPAFFLATQDNAGGATPDTVTISVPGLPSRGIAQCTVWAGDGSHRVPMMQRANQTPAIDSVRILVG